MNGMVAGGGQVRVRDNDWRSVSVPGLGAWAPRLAVSVVVPAFGCQQSLDLALASLAAQSYPGALLEVVVVDDGSTRGLRLGEVVPDGTRIIAAGPGGWGPSHAFLAGVAACSGEVVLRLEADMVVGREHVEAHARWHHLADYLTVIGDKILIEEDAGAFTPREVFEAVSASAAEALFEGRHFRAHWSDHLYLSTDMLVAAEPAWLARAAVGMTLSVRRALYERAGGARVRIPRGGDNALGELLVQAGAVFVPEVAARGWHLGLPQTTRDFPAAERARRPFLANRMPSAREHRSRTGRIWQVPYLDVVVQAADETGHACYEAVCATVDHLLASSLPDLAVTLVGPWPPQAGGRGDDDYDGLDRPGLDLVLIAEEYAHDPRVRLAEQVPATSAPAPWRMWWPPGWRLPPDALGQVLAYAEAQRLGLVELTPPGGAADRPAPRLERTAAFARARHLRAPGESVDDVVRQIAATAVLDTSPAPSAPVA